ncbi:MAG: insulinase family protein, partial [Phycisphaerales bacterium]|nr:insulinase family protein [Phycisphaerales bacterium]
MRCGDRECGPACGVPGVGRRDPCTYTLAMSVTFKQTTLDNGMTILAEIDPEAHSSAAGFFVKAGARDESTDLMGVSHYLEHMMF